MFTVRPLPGAPVSTPLRWEEVNGDLDIKRFTIANVPARFEEMGEDPMRPVMEVKPDLGAVLGRLADRMGGTSRPPER